MDPNPKLEEGQEATDQTTATDEQVADSSEVDSGDAGEQAADADASQDDSHD